MRPKPNDFPTAFVRPTLGGFHERQVGREMKTSGREPSGGMNDASAKAADVCSSSQVKIFDEPNAKATRRDLINRVWDLLAASPLVVWLLLGLSGSVSQITDLSGREGLSGRLSFGQQLVRITLSVLLIVLILIRVKTVRRSEGLVQRFAAVMGVVTPVVIIALPKSDISDWTMRVSLLLLLIGTVGSFVTLCWLGRSFSVTPQARRLVTSGPYRYIRHPLYLAELVTVFGLQLQFIQPSAFLIFATTLALQIVRMRSEESIMSEAFPAYDDYFRQKARLLPGIY